MSDQQLTGTGLLDEDIKKIQYIFALHPEVEKVILYGSRAKGNFKPYSDIDLTIVGKSLNLSILQILESGLDDLLLPYTFDLSIIHQIENPALIEHIQRVGKVIYILQK